MQALVAIILFVFDEVLFFIMDLIAEHGRNDYHVTGKHKLQAKIGGNGTISHMMQMVFSGFQDNDHTVNITGSNIGRFGGRCAKRLIDKCLWYLCFVNFARMSSDTKETER